LFSPFATAFRLSPFQSRHDLLLRVDAPLLEVFQSCFQQTIDFRFIRRLRLRSALYFLVGVIIAHLIAPRQRRGKSFLDSSYSLLVRFLEACIATGPRMLVRHERFSMSFPAWMIAQAQTGFTVIAFTAGILFISALNVRVIPSRIPGW
jgi:hypothetical protein